MAQGEHRIERGPHAIGLLAQCAAARVAALALDRPARGLVERSAVVVLVLARERDEHAGQPAGLAHHRVDACAPQSRPV